MSDTFSSEAQIVIAITPVVSGFLSILGSSMITYVILSDCKQTLGKTYHRLMLGMSISDIFASMNYCTSTFLMPAGTEGVWKASGTRGTCSMQGFFSQLALTTTWYSGCLALYFLLSIRGKLSESKISRRVEPIMHGFSISFGLLTATSGLFLGVYNPIRFGTNCYLAAYPTGCDEKDSQVECTRGEISSILIYAFAGIPTIINFCIVIFCMIFIFFFVRNQVRRIQSRYSVVEGQNDSSAATLKIRRARQQATLYILAFFLSYIWPSISRISEQSGRKGGTGSLVVTILAQVFYPLQGFMNFFIFVRPRYLDLRREFPDESTLRLFRMVFLRLAGGDRFHTSLGRSSRKLSRFSSLRKSKTQTQTPDDPSALQVADQPEVINDSSARAMDHDPGELKFSNEA